MRVAYCVAVAVAAVSACGKSAGPSTEKPRWKFLGFVDSPDHQLAVATVGGQVALVAPDGIVGTRIKLSHPEDEVLAIGLGNSSALIEGKVVHLLDARSGKQHWQQDLPNAKGRGLVAIGRTTLAVGHDDGASVLTLDAGRFIFTDQSRPTTALYFDPSGGYVMASRHELRLVDEPSGTIRWRRPTEEAGRARMRVTPGTEFLVIRPDRSFEEVEILHGQAIASGTCDGVSPSVDAKEDCAGPVPLDPTKENLSRLGRDSRGGDYSVVRRIDHDDVKGPTTSATLIARDAVGRTRWRSGWPLLFTGKSDVTRAESGKVVAFVVSAAASSDVRTLIAYDDLNGQLLFQHPLAGRESRLVGSADTCWLVTTRTDLSCLAARSGTPIWTIPVTSAAAVWTLPNGEALVADGGPLALSRIDSKGLPRWRTALPTGTMASMPSDGASSHLENVATKREWVFSHAMGVLEEDGELRVIDLADGQLHEVRR